MYIVINKTNIIPKNSPLTGGSLDTLHLSKNIVSYKIVYELKLTLWSGLENQTKHNTKLVTGFCKGKGGSRWDKHNESPWGFIGISE